MKKTMRKQFVIAGSNGTFYGKQNSLTAFKKRMKEIKKNLDVYGFGDYYEQRRPNELYVYEVVGGFIIDTRKVKKTK